jgi:hypothetical protein
LEAVEDRLGDCGALRGCAVEEKGEVYELGRVSGFGVMRRRLTGMKRLLLSTALVCGAILGLMSQPSLAPVAETNS